jgi:diadenosine tetraphosphate (Ap4A) HIT family hydrolase
VSVANGDGWDGFAGPGPKDCALCKSLATETPVYEDELWHVRPIEKPAGVAGWMIMVAKRHVQGPAHFNDAEAASFGPSLRRFEKTLEETTGALRIYTAALGEAVPHFHAHMIPRYADAPKKGWGLFDLQRAAKEGEIVVPEADITRITEAYRAALKVNR